MNTLVIPATEPTEAKVRSAVRSSGTYAMPADIASAGEPNRTRSR